MLIRLLEEAQEPVVLHIVGSSRDVAIAGFARPELFREKCRAIYLNAGSGCSEEELEYNVELDPFSYQSVFQLPCPIYWMPCFHSLKGVKDGRMCVGGIWHILSVPAEGNPGESLSFSKKIF